MLRCAARTATLGMVAAWLTMCQPAQAQFYSPISSPFSANNCACPCPTTAAAMPISTVSAVPLQTVSAPVTTVSCQPQVTMQCQPLVAVPQTQYRQVAVTEYRPKKVTVQRPVVETRYVDQEVTAYRPITEARTVQVPQVNYTPVTEYRTVQRDMGRWVTQRQCINRPSPCEYDGRPGFAGWWNRTAYNIRSTFTPRYRTVRYYQPNVVAQVVPQRRYVAQQCTKQVTYNVTRYEPYKTTRKVAVNSVRMVAEEVTQMEPVTVMKTMPVGTTIAWVNPAQLGNGTATALNPAADPLSTRSAENSRDTVVPPRRSANANDNRFRRTETPATGTGTGTGTGQPNNPDPFSNNKKFTNDPPFPPTGAIERQNENIQPASLRVPATNEPPRRMLPTPPAPRDTASRENPQLFSARKVPTAARVASARQTWSHSVRPVHADPALAPLTMTADVR